MIVDGGDFAIVVGVQHIGQQLDRIVCATEPEERVTCQNFASARDFQTVGNASAINAASRVRRNGNEGAIVNMRGSIIIDISVRECAIDSPFVRLAGGHSDHHGECAHIGFDPQRSAGNLGATFNPRQGSIFGIQEE